jgi:hypothetical protein
MEFKGTKGPLEPIYIYDVCIGIGTIGDYTQITANSILPDTDEDYDIEKEEIEANMKLYAAAPDLLRELEDCVMMLEGLHVQESALESAKKAIEKALL